MWGIFIGPFCLVYNSVNCNAKCLACSSWINSYLEGICILLSLVIFNWLNSNLFQLVLNSNLFQPVLNSRVEMALVYKVWRVFHFVMYGTKKSFFYLPYRHDWVDNQFYFLILRDKCLLIVPLISHPRLAFQSTKVLCKRALPRYEKTDPDIIRPAKPIL